MDRLAPASLLLLLAAVGCSSLDDFEADATRPYVGTVIGQSDPNCDAGTGCSFLRRGFGTGTRLVMTFDPDEIATSPGVLRTYAADGTDEPCGITLDGVPLVAIAPLAHDSLSQFNFPGDGRLRSFIFALSPTTGPLAGRDAYAFVSLMRDDTIEVRVLAGSGADDCSPTVCAPYLTGDCDFFGVFHLKRDDPP